MEWDWTSPTPTKIIVTRLGSISLAGFLTGDERRRREDGNWRGVHCESQLHPQPYLERPHKRRANSTRGPSDFETLDAHQIAPATTPGARVHAAARSDDPVQPGLCVEPRLVRPTTDTSPLPPRPTAVSLQTPPSTATIREAFEIRVREGEFDKIIPQGGVVSLPFRLGLVFPLARLTPSITPPTTSFLGSLSKRAAAALPRV
ncbi:hypothetical protein K438DRAFT_1986887 [Mycena galopus ATCC 62051]|nr:hypothetical protein K438DRAFT_1986887 [Mycena galopus ATCC 62051]